MVNINLNIAVKPGLDVDGGWYLAAPMCMCPKPRGLTAAVNLAYMPGLANS